MVCSMSEEVKLFIGTSSNGEDALVEMAYEYSLRKNSESDIDIVWMQQTNDEKDFWHGWDTSRWSTPFSGFRWAIPEYCNFKGRAIYTDVDMLNLRDISDLWNLDIPDDKWMLARDGIRFGGKEFCVILFDCNKFKNNIGLSDDWKIHAPAHHAFMEIFINKDLVGSLDPRWNCHDGDDLPVDDIWHLHYTEMATQPWRPSWYIGEQREHPRKDLVELFWEYVNEAAQNGYSPRDCCVGEEVKYNFLGK